MHRMCRCWDLIPHTMKSRSMFQIENEAEERLQQEEANERVNEATLFLTWKMLNISAILHNILTISQITHIQIPVD